MFPSSVVSEGDRILPSIEFSGGTWKQRDSFHCLQDIATLEYSKPALLQHVRERFSIRTHPQAPIFSSRSNLI